MSRTLREFEKALKRISRGESVAPGQIALQWKELADEGDRIVLGLLTRSGWESFARTIGGISELRAMLESLVSKAGMPAAALELFESLGIAAPPSDAPSRRALWIYDVAQQEDRGDRVRAHNMMLADPRMLEGALTLLEATPSPSSAAFLAQLLRAELTKEQDQRVRKSLYRLKQHGIAVEAKPKAAAEQKEWYLFGENRLPLWQLVFNFRFHSTFSSTGDLYILRILEGREFAPPDQKPDLRMTHSVFLQLGKKYSDQIERELGIRIPFHSVAEENAHFFLRQSLQTLEGAPGNEALRNFLRFIQAGEGVSPVLPSGSIQEGSTLLLDHEYFRQWMLDPEAFLEHSAELKGIESGPIVLVGAPLLEKKREAETKALQKYFDERRRRLWSNAFLKAAYFLKEEKESHECTAFFPAIWRFIGTDGIDSRCRHSLSANDAAIKEG